MKQIYDLQSFIATFLLGLVQAAVAVYGGYPVLCHCPKSSGSGTGFGSISWSYYYAGLTLRTGLLNDRTEVLANHDVQVAQTNEKAVQVKLDSANSTLSAIQGNVLLTTMLPPHSPDEGTSRAAL